MYPLLLVREQQEAAQAAEKGREALNALIAWAQAEQAVDAALEAWRAEVGENPPPAHASLAAALPSWSAYKTAEAASVAAFERVRALAHNLAALEAERGEK